MRLRVLLVATMALGTMIGPFASGAVAGAPVATDLLVPAAVLDRLDLVPVSDEPTPLPDELTCRHLEAAQTEADSGPSPATVAAQRSASDDDRVQLLDTVRVFPDAESARAYQRVFQAEDPTEECYEQFLVSQQTTDDSDIRADDRGGVRLDGAVTVAYLAGANFEDDELDVKAEALVARKGTVVIETFFAAPDDDQFPRRARTVQRALTAIFRSLDG